MYNQITFLDFIPYIVLVIICWLFAYYKIKDNWGARIIGGILLLFSALRYDVGWDYQAYVSLIEGQSQDAQFERIEWLSRWMMDLANVTFTQLYFIINAFIVFFFLYKIVIAYSREPALSLFLFLTFSLFFLMTMNIVRNFTAVLMVMYSCKLFLERKYIGYGILILLATGIHLSALIGLLIPFIFYFKQGRWVNISMFIGAFLVGVLIKNIILNFSEMRLFSQAAYYIMTQETEESGPYKYVIFIINIIFLIYWNKLVKINPGNKFWLNMMNVGACFWIVFDFQSTLSFRISLFYMVWLIILVPELLRIFPGPCRNLMKQIVMIGFTVLFFLNLYLLASAYNNGDILQASFLPYKIFFFQ